MPRTTDEREPGIIACGQFDILGDACPGCGGWLHREVRDGYAGQHGSRWCSEDCITEQQALVVRNHIDSHYGTRDLLCACEICAANGLPTQAMRQEYADYLASIEGTALAVRRATD